MTPGGYVRLYRSLIGHPVFADAELLKLFVYCVLKANHKPKSVAMKSGRGSRMINVGRGEFVTGRRSLATEFTCPPSSIRNRLSRLVKLGCIAIFEDHQFSRIRITNYGIYQPLKDEQGPAKDHPKDHQSGPPKTNGEYLENKLFPGLKTTNEDHPNKSKVDTNKKSKQEVNTLFEKWWPEYPKKVSKPSAAKEFRIKLKMILSRGENNSFEFLLERTRQFAESRIGQPAQYTPHPATWLHNDRFDEDPESWAVHEGNGHTIDRTPVSFRQ